MQITVQGLSQHHTSFCIQSHRQLARSPINPEPSNCFKLVVGCCPKKNMAPISSASCSRIRASATCACQRVDSRRLCLRTVTSLHSRPRERSMLRSLEKGMHMSPGMTSIQFRAPWAAFFLTNSTHTRNRCEPKRRPIKTAVSEKAYSKRAYQ